MPPTSGRSGRLRVGRYFLSLFLILAALYSIVIFSSQSNAPKLGLDLEGGAQITFKAVTTNGKTPSKDSMRVAREILTTRVNGAGVSSAEVVQEGSDRIVVSVPGKSVADIASIGQAAQLNFRPVIAAPINANPNPTPSGSATASGSASGSPTPSSGASKTAPQNSGTSSTTKSPTSSGTGSASSGANNIAAVAPTPSASSQSAPSTAATTGSPSASPSPSGSSTSGSGIGVDAKAVDPLAGLTFTLPTTDTAFTALSAANKSALLAKMAAYSCKQNVIDNRTKPLVACDTKNQVKYLLGPVVVPGSQIKTAQAVAPNPGQQGGSSVWTVALDLKGGGQKAWSEYTGKHNSPSTTSGVEQCNPDFSGQAAASGGLPCAEYVGFTLDGKVISAPHNEAAINGTTSISGGFTETTANELANQLKFGALPLSFVTQNQSDVTATLGLGQLKAGMLAGGIGLVLVVLYSLIYYRGLGFVTIASLLVSGGLTYACLVILGREIGFTLTLAGIAGFIVAVGITADSFVVFFERIKDEVHDGRSFATAVPRAWARARRTIISADVVSLLAAVILYALSAGDVRGFAFTLGLSTLLDLVIVFLFTHPLVALLARSRAFGSPRFTGLNAVRTRTSVAAEQERLETAAGVPARRSGGSGGARTALLERDTSTGDDGDDDILDLTGSGNEPDEPAVPAVDEEPDPAEDHKASARQAAARRRARAERDAITDTGMSAAERAAARRGRQVRPPREEIADEVDAADEDDTELIGDTAETSDVSEPESAPEPAPSRRGRRRRARAEAPGLAEIPEPALEPADEVEPVEDEVDDRPVVDTSSIVVDEESADDVIDADPTAPAAAEPDPARAVDTSTSAASEKKPSSAAERAAARRARLKAKAEGEKS